jgi:DNA-binding response OmpR family regulator
MNASAGGRPKILIVEDEIIIAMEIQIRLEAAGFAVCGIATTGEKAILAHRERTPDLILMDITLRGSMDGLEAAERILSERPVPVIFLSAAETETVRKRIDGIVGGRFLAKPFDEVELIAAVGKALAAGSEKSATP